MSGLLEDVLAAHGGLERWRAVTALTVHGRFGGLLRTRFPGNRMTAVTARVHMAEQHVVFHHFPREDQRAVFDRGDVRIETSDGEPIVQWDALDAAYFAGYAWWNYLSAPLLLTRDDITVTEAGDWRAQRTRWRRLEVTFPAHIHTHSARQTFYIDDGGLIRRHDYVAEPVGRWARAAHYCDQHRHFDGLVFPTRNLTQRNDREQLRPGSRRSIHVGWSAAISDHS